MTQDQRLLKHAADMRHEATPAQVILWRHLSGSKLGGHKFRRQHVVESRIVDFFCPAKNVAVEVDGATHDPGFDARRDAALLAEGVHVVRFTNADVSGNLVGVLQHLLEILNDAPDRWAAPHPNPSPKGEGLDSAKISPSPLGEGLGVGRTPSPPC